MSLSTSISCLITKQPRVGKAGNHLIVCREGKEGNGYGKFSEGNLELKGQNNDEIRQMLTNLNLVEVVVPEYQSTAGLMFR